MQNAAFERSFGQALDHRDRLTFEFAVIELDLAITFCKGAKATADQAAAERNAKHARQAFRAAMKALRRCNFKATANSPIRRKVNHVRALLSKLKR